MFFCEANKILKDYAFFVNLFKTRNSGYLILGIETVENIIARDKYKTISDKIKQLEKKQERKEHEKGLFNDELQDIVNKIKGYGLIQNDLNLDDAIKQIEILLKNFTTDKIQTESSNRSDLESQLTLAQYKLRNLKSFQDEYKKYKDTEKKNLESLKPIEYLLEKDSELVKTSIYEDILTAYKTQISEIKQFTSDKTPVNNQIREMQISLEKKISEFENALNALPTEDTSFSSFEEKVYYLGQVKSKFDLYKNESNNENNENYSDQISALETQLAEISVKDIASQKEIAKATIESYIKKYMEILINSLGNYKDYIPCFNMEKKNLQLINPAKGEIESVGSSSNHMFMQLLFSLGVQELAFVNKSKFLAPFLLIDQPSRPYYGANNEKVNMDSSDESKIKKAFDLLNYFISQRHKNNGSFQMIVLEHIPKEYVENLENVHIVEEFFNENALIPQSEYIPNHSKE